MGGEPIHEYPRRVGRNCLIVIGGWSGLTAVPAVVVVVLEQQSGMY